MRIAMLSSIAWRTPPRHYGPWERVVSLLTEGLVARGVDVTLFATADSETDGGFHAIVPRPYEEDKGLIPKVWESLHISEVFERAQDFDLIHNHFDFLPLTYSGLVKRPVLTTIHGFSSEKILPVYRKYNGNSGMFMWRTAAILKAVETHLPALDTAIKEILPALNTPDEAAVLREAYAKIEGISVDYGIMEKAENVVCMPIDAQWNDVGTWTALGDVWAPDQRGNCTEGEVVLLDCKSCIVTSPHRVTTLIGLEDLVIVDTPDALLVCRKDRSQDVRTLHALLAGRGYGHLL